VCGHGERELKALKCYEVQQGDFVISEEVTGKHVAVPHGEDSLEVSTKLLLAAPLR